MSDPSTVRTIPGTSAKESKPDYQRPEYQAAEPHRALCRALMEGTTAVRALGEAALPKWPAEKPDKYAHRAKATRLVRYYGRTVEASVGMICATPPALADGADATIAADWEDIDGKGTHGEVFARHLATEIINGGFCGVLVDAPPLPPAGVKFDHEDEIALGLRPYWVLIPASRIISWIADAPDWPLILATWASGTITAEQAKAQAKRVVLRQVVIYEPTDAVAGSFGIATADRYRVLRLTDAGVTFTVWEKRKPDNTGSGEYFALVAEGEMRQAKQQPFREIPLAIIYGGTPDGPLCAPPPLLGLAELNLDHYQVTADRRYLMRLCHAPTLFLAGFTPDMDEEGNAKSIEVGPNSVITSPDPQARGSYLAASPDALDSSQEERNELVSQMAALGMSFIGKDRRTAAETATGRALDDAAENSTHATVARGLQDGLEQALKFHAAYRGATAPEVIVNTTYASAQVDPQIAAVIWQAVAADKMPVEAFIEYITKGQLPDNIEQLLEGLRRVQQAQDEADAAAEAEIAKQTAKNGMADVAVGGPSMVGR